jgi:hypothetical protein
MHLSVRAAQELPLSGVLVVGAQDFRSETGKLLPLSMLVLEDIIRVVGDEHLKLKELSKGSRYYQGYSCLACFLTQK